MKEYGDIVRLKVPGAYPNLLLLSNPEHFHFLSQKESRIPHMPFYDLFDYIRGERLPEKYPTKGLITNSEVTKDKSIKFDLLFSRDSDLTTSVVRP